MSPAASARNGENERDVTVFSEAETLEVRPLRMATRAFVGAARVGAFLLRIRCQSREAAAAASPIAGDTGRARDGRKVADDRLAILLAAGFIRRRRLCKQCQFWVCMGRR